MYEIQEFLWIVTHRDNTVTVKRGIMRVSLDSTYKYLARPKLTLKKTSRYSSSSLAVRQLRSFQGLTVMNIASLVTRVSALLERAKDTEACKNNSRRPHDARNEVDTNTR